MKDHEKNVLCWKKSYALNKYLEDNPILATENNDEFVCKAAEKNLGFKVTVANIKTSRLTVDIHYQGKPSARNYGGAESKALHRQDRSLARGVLCALEGKTPSPLLMDALRRIAERHNDPEDA